MSDILLKNAVILTMDDNFSIIEDGFILIKDDEIVKIDKQENISSIGDINKYKVIDCKNKIVMPGMINTHSHLSMMVFRSLADDVKDRLQKYLFPLEQRAMDEKMAVSGANYAFAELISSGVTTVYDAYYFENSIAEAASKVGIRGVFSETIINSENPNGKNAKDGIEYSKRFIKNWKDHKLISPAVNCHALYTNTKENLIESHNLSKEFDVLMCMHVSEMDYEVSLCEKEYGLTPIGYLDSIGILDEKFLAAHAIFTNESDMKILKNRNVKVSYNAGSNAKSGKGVTPIYEMIKKGITVSLGTDGPMSGNTIDIITQLSLVGKIQKLFNKDRTIFTAKEILRLATIEGAKALLLDDKVGSLEVGKKADIIIFETDSVNMSPIYDYYSAIVYSSNPSNVDTTIVNGEILMENKILKTIDIKRAKDDLFIYKDKISKIAYEIDNSLKS